MKIDISGKHDQLNAFLIFAQRINLRVSSESCGKLLWIKGQKRTDRPVQMRFEGFGAYEEDL
jgi:hypothetical protein